MRDVQFGETTDGTVLMQPDVRRPLLPEEVKKGEPIIKPEGYAIGAPGSLEVTRDLRDRERDRREAQKEIGEEIEAEVPDEPLYEDGS
jgi:hypothetical protein